MQCKITECVSHKDCGILEITNKEPKHKLYCSYFRNQQQLDKKNKKLEIPIDTRRKKRHDKS